MYKPDELGVSQYPASVRALQWMIYVLPTEQELIPEY
jgi:hypothetical protein